MPGIKKLADDRQLSFHDHWLLACGTDAVYGVDRCKTQTFEFGKRNKQKHVLQLSTWGAEETNAGHNISFWPTKGGVDGRELLGISFDWEQTRWLEPCKDYCIAHSFRNRVVINNFKLMDELMPKLAEADNLRIFYTDHKGKKRTAMFSLIGFQDSFAALKEKEASPRYSEALGQRLVSEGRFKGKWHNKSELMSFEEGRVIHRTNGRNRYHYENQTGSGYVYAGVVYGETDLEAVQQLLNGFQIKIPELEKKIAGHMTSGETYPATVIHAKSNLLLTAEVEPNKVMMLEIQAKGRVGLFELDRVLPETQSAALKP